MERALFLMELEFFQSVGSEQIAHIAAEATEDHFDAGAVIYDENKPARGLYVVLEGVVEMRSKGTAFRKVTRGEGFGFAAVLGSEDSTASAATALEHTHVLTISKEDFIDTVGDHPQLAVDLVRGLATQMVNLGREVEELKARIRELEEKDSAEKT
jgi:signal-transduction protein with cAMP-binding, CBS, and nucleotidyltransferase domain